VRTASGLAILAFFLLHAAGFVRTEILARLEALAYDARVRLTLPGTPDPRVVIVDIDEKSLAEEGRWPWSRDRVALLLDKLFDAHKVAVVGFDVVFAEADASSGLPVLEALAHGELSNTPGFRDAVSRLAPKLDRDAAFARALSNRPVVLGVYFTSETGFREVRRGGVLPAPAFPRKALTSFDNAWVLATGYGANLPALQTAAGAAGHMNHQLDDDGVARRVPLVIEFDGAHYEALSVAVVRRLLGGAALDAGTAQAGDYHAVERFGVAGLDVPVDVNGAALVPFRGRAGTFRYVSASDVLRDRVPAGTLAGKVVLVGTTAPGLMDLRATPVGNVFPGVEVHANMVSGILSGSVRERPAWEAGAELALILVSGVVLLVLLPRCGVFASTLACVFALAAITGANFWAWNARLVLPLVAPLLLVLALWVWHTAFGYFVEARAERQITRLFGQYVPPELVDEMARDPGCYSMDGESHEMTVLFSDIRSFTTLSEGLSPKDMVALMNAFFTPMTEIIHRHRGTIDKYIGDAIMAFWGAPLADPEHARHAAEAATEMRAALVKLGGEFATRGWPKLDAGIGINSGTMNVGNMGSEFRRAYTVMGDAVNLASRLEGLTKKYRVPVILGEETRRALVDQEFVELDRVRVKGKKESVAIYDGRALTPQRREAAQRFAAALAACRARDWASAQAGFEALADDAMLSGPVALYLGRIARFRADPPPADWDGVFAFDEK
jgi:adenylate cyclase